MPNGCRPVKPRAPTACRGRYNWGVDTHASARVVPPGSGGLEAVAAVTEAVATYRTRLTYRTLLARLVLVLVFASAVPLLVVMADHAWAGGLPRVVMVSVLVAWLVALGGTLVGVLVHAFVCRWNPVFVARQIERTSGIEHNSLVNALLLRASAEALYAEAAAVQQAARDLASHEPAERVEPAMGRRPAAAALGVAVVWVVYLLVAPKPIGPSLARFLGAHQAAPTATWLELVRPGADEAPHIGVALEMEFAVHGRAVPAVRLDILDPNDGGRPPIRQFVSTESSGSGGDLRRFVLAPHEVQHDIAYCCRAGDGVLRGTIRVEPQPDVERLEVVLEPPAYTGWPCAVAAGPDLSVLAGTRAVFRVTANALICDPVFVFSNAHETRTRMSADPDAPRVASAALLLTESGQYHVEFSDPWAVPYRNSTRQRVDVRPDEPPRVRIAEWGATSPEVPDRIDVARCGQLGAVASDDVGVVKVMLVAVAGGETRRYEPAVEEQRGRTLIRALVATRALEVRPDQPVQVWFEVSDGRVLPDGRPAPQTATSEVVTLFRSEEGPTAEQVPGGNGPPEPFPEVPEDDQPNADGESTGADGEAVPGEGQGEQGEGQPGDADGQPTAGAEGGTPDNAQPGDAEAPAPRSADGAGEAGDQAAGDAAREAVEELARDHADDAAEAGRRLRDSQPTEEDQPGEEADPNRGECGQPGTGAGSSGDTTAGGQPNDRQSPSPADADGDASGDNEGSANPSEQQSGSEREPQPDQPPQAKSDKPGGAAGESKPEGESGPDREQPGAEKQPDSQGSASSGGGGVGEDVPDGPASLPPESQPDQDPTAPAEPLPDAAPLPESEGRAAVLDLLEMLERGAVLTEDMLVDAGWSTEKAADFIRELERVRQLVRHGGGIGRLRREVFDTRLGDDDWQGGRGVADDLRREAERVEARADGLRRIAPPVEQSVPSELEAILDAYYRSLAAHQGNGG